MFSTILTNAGIALETAASASGTQFTISQMAVGDGGGNPTTPDPAETQLVREVYRATLNSIAPDVNNPGQFVAELVIPSTIGGFTIREAALITSDGTFFAVCNTPSVYKPNSTEGAYSDTVLKMTFKVSNASTINLTVDPNVSIATRTWVENYAVPANIIPGGLVNQVLAKNSSNNGDVIWKDPSAAVQVIVDTVEEDQTLSAGQTSVILSSVTTQGLAIYVEGVRLRNNEWSIVDATHLTLDQSYNNGSHVTFVQNEQTGFTDVLRQANALGELQGVAATARGNIGAAASATLITAGLGLSGGGDLSQNRTISINFATDGQVAASMAVQANDSRLSNARQATKLQTAVTIGIGGVGSGSVSFDGSGNVTIPLALNATGVTGGPYGDTTHVGTFTVQADGRLTLAGSAAIAFPVTSVFGRTGAVALTSADVTGALGYTPVNKAGDTMTGALTVQNGGVNVPGGMGLLGTTSGAGTGASVLQFAAGKYIQYSIGSNQFSFSGADLSSLTVDGTITAPGGVYATWPIATGTIANGGNGGNNGFTCHANNNGGSTATSCAAITFIRDGQYGAYFGLDTDNQFKFGGWSFGNNSYRVMHEGLAAIHTVGTIQAGSDIRVKLNPVPITGALSTVRDYLVGHTYHRTDLDGKFEAGFLAQKVKEGLPHLVAVADNSHAGIADFHYMDYDHAVAYVAAAVTELESIVTAQRRMIDELLQRVAALESR